MNIKKWLKQNTHSLKGKTVAITGSTGGLGGEICKILASLNARLVLLNRNEEKTQIQIEELKTRYPNLQIKFVKTDMQNIESVKQTCLKLNHQEIDILILNAGAFNLPRKKSSLGYDNVFQINFVSAYYLTKKLLSQLQSRPDSKVVVVGSIAHAYAKLNSSDIDYSTEEDVQKVYGNSKRFLMFSLYKLFETEKHVKLSITHPGITLTGITQNYKKIFLPIIKLSMKLLYMPPKKACLSIIKGVFDQTSTGYWIGPERKNIWGYPKKRPLEVCSEQECEDIFKIAEKIYAKLNNQ